MNKFDKVCQEALIEMFHRVGLEMTWDEILEYAEADEDWYQSKEWTKAEDSAFSKYLRKKIKKSMPGILKKSIDSEVAMFMLMWGWKTVK